MTPSTVVSVVIPTFDRAGLVEHAIESALRQSNVDVEVLVVDDGSTDDTSSRLFDRYAGVDRVRLLEIDHSGPAAARNTALTAATGSHVAFLDSDDRWEPWKLEFQLRCLAAVPDAGMVWTDMAAVDTHGELVAATFIRALYRRHGEIDIADVMERTSIAAPAGEGDADLWHGDLYPVMIHGNLVHTSTVLLTRDRLEAVGRFDEDLTGTGEDFDFHLRTCEAGPVAFADISTTRWRVGAPDQLTHPDLMAQMAANFLTTVEKAIARQPARLTADDRRVGLARAHGWLGEELLDSGERRRAAEHLRLALPAGRRIRTLGLLFVSRLPPRLGTVVRRLLGPLTRPFRRRAAG